MKAGFIPPFWRSEEIGGGTRGREEGVEARARARAGGGRFGEGLGRGSTVEKHRIKRDSRAPGSGGEIETC